MSAALQSLVVALLVAAANPATSVEVPPVAETGTIVSERIELVVVEAPECAYCRLFRRNVMPAYESSPQIRQMPVRFVDADTLDASRIRISRAVDVVPTAILMRDGMEVGRISGYAGAENFFRSINHLLATLH